MNAYQKLLAFLMSVLGILLALYFANVFINSTPSLPLGFYFKDVRLMSKGNIVMYCLDDKSIPAVKLAFERKYYEGAGGCYAGDDNETMMLMKPVVATSGDIVELNENGVYVNGQYIKNSKPLQKDSKDRPMVHYPFGKYTVDFNELWVISSYNHRSFDSRYYGPISTFAVKHTAKPLLVWDGQ